MSQFQYQVSIAANGDATPLRIDDNGSPLRVVAWSDTDFQSWNAAQQPPYALSPVQQTIQALKAMSYAAWQAQVTAAQKDRILYELVQRALRNEIV